MHPPLLINTSHQRGRPAYPNQNPERIKSYQPRPWGTPPEKPPPPSRPAIPKTASSRFRPFCSLRAGSSRKSHIIRRIAKCEHNLQPDAVHLRDRVNGTRTRPKLTCPVQIISPCSRNNQIFPTNRVAHNDSHDGLSAAQATQAFCPAPGPKHLHLITPTLSSKEACQELIH